MLALVERICFHTIKSKCGVFWVHVEGQSEAFVPELHTDLNA